MIGKKFCFRHGIVAWARNMWRAMSWALAQRRTAEELA
jgi:ribulose-5-phosphate 4-epimerase/fuculose-1-phosphate aldolase